MESTAPSVYPHLLQPTLSAGSRAAIELENGAPLSNYTVHASLSGPGNQNAPGGPMLDLAPNLILVGSMNTNIFGSARLTVPVPPGSEGVQVWIQAWNPSEAATMTSAVVQ